MSRVVFSRFRAVRRTCLGPLASRARVQAVVFDSYL